MATMCLEAPWWTNIQAGAVCQCFETDLSWVHIGLLFSHQVTNQPSILVQEQFQNTECKSWLVQVLMAFTPLVRRRASYPSWLNNVAKNSIRPRPRGKEYKGVIVMSSKTTRHPPTRRQGSDDSYPSPCARCSGCRCPSQNHSMGRPL